MLREMIALPLRIGVRATRFGAVVAGTVVIAGLRAGERVINAALPPLRAPVGHPDERAAGRRIRVGIMIQPRSSTADPSSAAATHLEAAEPAPAGDGAATEPAAPPTSPPTPGSPATPQPRTAPHPATRAHVSEEPRLVASFADAGAEDGAGATVHVAEPWKGYARMTATDVIARLTDASREELAAVELYESTHRARRTVLAAADRQLRRDSAATGART
jgi:hypothetical protein